MKRMDNTILHLFDFLTQSSMVICATNQKDMLDDALLCRFDLAIALELPDQKQIQELIQLVLKEGQFGVDRKVAMKKLIEAAQGLSYYSIQKTLINAIKQSLFAMKDALALKPKINTQIWHDLLVDINRPLTNTRGYLTSLYSTLPC